MRQQGATLDLHYDSGLKALRVAGLLEAFKKRYRPGAELLKLTDEKTFVRFADAEEGRMTDWDSDYFRPEIGRGPLRELLIDSL